MLDLSSSAFQLGSMSLRLCAVIIRWSTTRPVSAGNRGRRRANETEGKQSQTLPEQKARAQCRPRPATPQSRSKLHLRRFRGAFIGRDSAMGCSPEKAVFAQITRECTQGRIIARTA